MSLQDYHNHSLEDWKTDPADFENTCLGCKHVLSMIAKATISAETLREVQNDDWQVKEFMDNCLHNDITLDQNLRFLARDNPEQESIDEFVTIAELARIRMRKVN